MTVLKSIRDRIPDDKAFEEAVFMILMRSGAYDVDWRRGGADGARDIVAKYDFDGLQATVFVECKFYSTSVPLERIRNTLEWARVRQVQVVYFWACPYLTNDTKDFLENFTAESGITVEYEDEHTVLEYLEDVECNDYSRIRSIKEKIYRAFRDTGLRQTMPLEYESCVLNTDHTLIDREEEREHFKKEGSGLFYVLGMSGAGKTELVKNIALQRYREGKPVFWHTLQIEEDGDAQARHLFHAFAGFVSTHASRRFSDFLHEFGCNGIAQLASLANTAPFKKRPILFFDDFHKCSSEKLFPFLSLLMESGKFDVVFIGWFDAFPHGTARHDVCFVHVEGLPKRHVCAMAEHVLGHEPPEDLVRILHEECQGMPYFITLSNEMKALLPRVETINGTDDILGNIFGSLVQGERVVVRALSASQVPLSAGAFRRFKYLKHLNSLVRKKLVNDIGGLYKVHDTLKHFVQRGSSVGGVCPDAYRILLHEAIRAPSINIDLIRIHLGNFEYKDALALFNQSYLTLMDQGYDLTLLDLITNLLGKTDDIKGLSWKKALLLERAGQYRLASATMALLTDTRELVEGANYDILYTRARLMYFENRFDDMLTLLLDEADIFSAPKNEHVLLLIFLVARVYHVRSDFEVALHMYLYLMKRSAGCGNRMLFLKALHRIAMIELSLGFVDEAKACFAMLDATDLTRKRQSYVYYRLAKCELKQGNYDVADELNDKSITIKTNMDHRRGLVFSWKLKANIKLAQGDTYEGLLWAEEAHALAKELSLEKEEVATGIVLCDALYELRRIDDAQLILDRISMLAQKMKLAHRVKVINDRYSRLGIPNECSPVPFEEVVNRNALIQMLKSDLGKEHRLQIKNLLASIEALTPIIRNIFPV